MPAVWGGSSHMAIWLAACSLAHAHTSWNPGDRGLSAWWSGHVARGLREARLEAQLLQTSRVRVGRAVSSYRIACLKSAI
jgi:hypothetical protein